MIDLKAFTKELEHLVNIDSGTYYAEGVNKVGDWFAEKFSELGWNKTDYKLTNGELGDSILFCNESDKQFDLLILCHLDTVFPQGEVAKRPFTIDGTKFRGPGVADMKNGCLFTYYAVKQLQEEGRLPANIGVFFNGEHEISCPNTRPVIEELSKKSKIVIASEPARADGSYVKRRKGIGRYKVKFTGKAAHSGVNPQDGICAVTELSKWVLDLSKHIDLERGTYINPGIIKGGVAVNSVPESAELILDTRFSILKDGEAIDEKIRMMSNEPFDERIKVELSGGITRPPMNPNDTTEKLCELVNTIGQKFDVDVKWTFSGGGSDASFASAFGIPSLCGLAAVGGGLHSDKEYLETNDLIPRFSVYKEMIFQFSIYK